MSLVIKKWYASKTPDKDGNYVHLVGREGGLISWILSLLRIDATVEVEVKDDVIRFVSSSLAGKQIRVIPMKSITSAFYGYEKPWKAALLLTVLLMPALIGLIVGPLYYILNKNLTVAVVEASGWVGAFSFRRSVIEGQNIDEERAYQIIELIRTQIESQTT
ncbi:MAG: hypothetical protein D6694_07645 [Gammaproteobacteria bacterium]|nr:MAG: hypothetical protein D6694_07645 [Gammaproteobacteria bacterium]